MQKKRRVERLFFMKRCAPHALRRPGSHRTPITFTCFRNTRGTEYSNGGGDIAGDPVDEGARDGVLGVFHGVFSLFI